MSCDDDSSATIAYATLLSVFAAAPSYADDQTKADTIAACAEAARLLEEDDIDGALDEAEWCREGLTQIKQGQTLAAFPDKVGGYTGGEISNDGAMGMTMLGREYENGSKKIKVEITSGAAAGLGALTELMDAFGKMGMEGKKIRIQRRTVIDSSEGGSANLTVRLKSGGMMSVNSSSVSGEEAIEFLKEFPIAELDDSMAR